MGLEKFLFMEDFVIKCPLDSDAIAQRMRDSIEPRRLFRTWLTRSSTPRWEGNVEGMKFSIRKIQIFEHPPYGTYFGPSLNGRIDDNCVEVKSRLHPLIWIFLFFWFGFLLYYSLLIIIQVGGILLEAHISFYQLAAYFILFLLADSMIVLVYHFMKRSYRYETKNQLEALRALLDGHSIAHGSQNL